MKCRIEATGTFCGSNNLHIFNKNGEDITKALPIRRLDIHIRPYETITATLEVAVSGLDIEAEMKTVAPINQKEWEKQYE